MSSISKLTKDIFLFTGLFDDLDEIFSILDKSQWEVWGRNNNDPNYRIGELTKVIENEYLLNKVVTITQQCLTDYMNEMDIDPSLYYHDGSGIYIRKWDYPMMGMNAHRDYTYGESDEIKKVEYTICVYLNDTYEGGRIEFPEQKLSIKPPAGSAVVFPSHRLHLVTDVKDGHRYMWSSFVYKK